MASNSYPDAGLLADTGFWFTISFVIFAVIVWKFGKGFVLGMLDSRIETIKNDIKTAENLRVEAQELLAQYQRKQRDAEKEAAHILEDAKRNAYEVKKAAEKNLKDLMKRKEAQLEERIKRMQESAVQEIQAYAADLAIQATAGIIQEQMDNKLSDKLLNEAIEDIKKVH